MEASENTERWQGESPPLSTTRPVSSEQLRRGGKQHECNRSSHVVWAGRTEQEAHAQSVGV